MPRIERAHICHLRLKHIEDVVQGLIGSLSYCEYATTEPLHRIEGR
jgi:hypothetical protein